MSLVKIKSSHKYKANQTNVLLFVGQVTFDENSIIEVEEDVVEKLLKFMPEFSLVSNEEDIKKKSEDTEELGESKEDDIKPQVVEDEAINSTIDVTSSDIKSQENVDEQSSEVIKIALEEKPAKELKEMLNQFPKELVKDLKNKKQYVEFLLTQLTS